jgi:hypothetical protein
VRSPRIALHGGRNQALIALQVLRETLGNFVGGSRVHTSGGTDSLFAQEAQQQPQRVPFPASSLKHRALHRERWRW